MPKDAELALTSAMHDQRLKYIYFLLTATGACIGFAVTQTRESEVSWIALPLGAAVLCWAASFFCGCRSLYLRPVALFANIEFLKIVNRRLPYRGLDSASAEVLISDTKELHSKVDTRAAWYMRQQFTTFLIACSLFLLWHVLEMWDRTPPLPA